MEVCCTPGVYHDCTPRISETFPLKGWNTFAPRDILLSLTFNWAGRIRRKVRLAFRKEADGI